MAAARKPPEPRWLSRAIVELIHAAQLREHVGGIGIRDEGMLESALARPRHKFEYDAGVDLTTLAAAYLFGLAKNHAFVDGNKRVAFMAAYVFLAINGRELEANEAELCSVLDALGGGRLTEGKLGKWIGDHLA